MTLRLLYNQLKISPVETSQVRSLEYLYTLNCSEEEAAGWASAVRDAVWRLSSGTSTTQHQFCARKQTLEIWLMEPCLVLQKIVTDLGGVRRSYLGPPECFRVGIDSIGQRKGISFNY
jgi:hypothetical protein